MIELQALGWKRSIRNVLVGAIQELEVMCPMSKRLEILGWRLIICAKKLRCRMHDKGDQTPPSSSGWRNIVKGKVRAHSLGAGEMMQ